MSDTHDELFNRVCSPWMAEQSQKMDALLKAVVLGNGVPPLMTRVAVLEERAKTTDKQDEPSACRNAGKSISFGPLKIDGYAASDVGKIALGVGVAVLLYMNWHGLQDRRDLADRAETLVYKTERDRTELNQKIAELAKMVAANERKTK